MVPRRLAAFVAIGSLLVVGTAQASAIAAFHVPAWAIQCVVAARAETSLSDHSLSCSRKSDGLTLELVIGGAASVSRHRGDPRYRDPFAARRSLPIGRHWALRDGRREYLHCVHQRSRVLCWNRAGRGFWLGRTAGYRLF